VKFIIAGQVHSKKVKQMLNALSCSNITVHDKFLTDEELDTYSLAANIGFLSYRSILTSGTLFHMMSAKLPVIAPALGTLPAYIAKGWNGFIYKTPQDLEKILRHCCQLPTKSVAEMGCNAYQLASSLKWRFF
jgi:glycosyltransferase involved in cell wall biosynthesis